MYVMSPLAVETFTDLVKPGFTSPPLQTYHRTTTIQQSLNLEHVA
jgi:hypothetical protein